MKKQGKNIVYGKAVRPNAGIRAWYRAVLRALVDDMTQKVQKNVLRVYKKYEDQIRPQKKAAMDANISSRAEAELRELQHQIEDEFRKKARKIAEQFVSRTSKYADTTTKDSLKGMISEAAWSGFSVKPSKISESMAAVLKASIYENVDLINNLPEKYFNAVAGAVYRNITAGASSDTIKRALQYCGHIAERRAELIARDQSQKAFEALSRERMKGAGITHFEWVATGGGLYPRQLHHTHVNQGGLNHGIYSFDNPPVIQESYVPKTPRGTARGPIRGFPGDLPYCQCVKRPVIILEDKKVL